MVIDGKVTISSPYDTPGQMWKNGDHWNYLNLGEVHDTMTAFQSLIQALPPG